MSDRSVCPTTQEAVIERELEGEMGCPICGRTAEDHRPEWATELAPLNAFGGWGNQGINPDWRPK